MFGRTYRGFRVQTESLSPSGAYGWVLSGHGVPLKKLLDRHGRADSCRDAPAPVRGESTPQDESGPGRVITPAVPIAHIVADSGGEKFG